MPSDSAERPSTRAMGGVQGRSREGRGARRLSPEARRDQLVDAATAVIAEQGYADFSLDDVGARSDVTRNLLYHYFPRGRIDLFLAALDRAGTELTDAWIVDPEIPAAERTRANVDRVADHVLSETDSWLVYRQARGLADADVQAHLRRHADALVESVFVNQLGTPEPPPIAAAALRGLVAFVEAALDDARERGVPRDEIVPFLVDTVTPIVVAGVREGTEHASNP